MTTTTQEAARPVSSPRTLWRSKDCDWSNRERVVALGEEHGAAGPLLLDFLEEQAKKQDSDGRVRTGLRALARAAFLPRGDGLAEARAILTTAAAVGALDDLEITDGVDLTVTCRVSGFAADQEHARRQEERADAAERQRRKRDRDRAATSQDDRDASRAERDGHAESHEVTKVTPTEQNRTEQGNPPVGPPDGGAMSVPIRPRKPTGKRDRDLTAYLEQMKAYEQHVEVFAHELFPDHGDTGQVLAAVQGALGSIRPNERPTPELIRARASRWITTATKNARSVAA